MAPKNSRTSHPAARSSRAPQSARAVRTARAAQSGRIASRSQAEEFAQTASAQRYAGYRSAYVPGSQGPAANAAYSRQSAASQYSRNNASYSTAARKRSGKGKKIAIGVIAAVIVAAVGCTTAFALWKNSVNEQLTRGNKTDEEINAINDMLAPTNAEFTDPFYMMLIGTDEAEDSVDETHRSDTNIVVRVDPVNNQATMVSIPRDTKIEIDGYGTNKFNAAYSYDGAAGAIREANELLGIQISHYAEVNFGKLKDLVDAVGGVDVVVPERIDDPDADGTSAHPEWPRVIIEEGEQHLDGNQALVFARSRAYVDGDFTRTANQRSLIMAIINKVLSMSAMELAGVVQSATACVTTDLAVGDIVTLAGQFQDEGDLVFYSAMLPSTTATIDGVSYVINDAASTKKMMEVVESGGDPSGITASAEAYAEAEALNGTGSGAGMDASSGGSGYYDSSYYYDPGYSSGYTDPSYSGTGTGTGTGYVDNSTYYGDASGGTGYVDSGSYGGSADTSGGTAGGGYVDSGTASGGGYDTGGYDAGASGGAATGY